MNIDTITMPVETFSAMQAQIQQMSQQLVTLTKAIATSATNTQKGETVTLDAFFHSWAATKEHEIQSTTYEKNLHMYKRISKTLGNRSLSSITRADVQDFINDMTEKGLSMDTIKHTKGLLSSVFRLAAGDGYILKNPCTAVTLPRIPKQKKRPATPEEYATLLAVSRNHRLGFTLPLLFEMGLRKGEMLALTWADVDMKAKCLNIDKQLVTNNGKGKAELKHNTKTKAGTRQVFLSDKILKLLQEHRKTQGKQCLFVVANKTEDGMTQPTVYSKIFNGWRDRGNLSKDITPHTGRHYFIANMLKNDVAPEILRHQTGHADLTTLLDIYGYDNNELSKRDRQKLEAAQQELSPIR